MDKKKVLIVGGSSGLGIHITKLYLNKNYSVISISRKINPKLKKNVKQIICDVSNLDKLKEVLKKLKRDKISFDIIIHNVGGSQKIYEHDVDYKSYELVWKSNLGYIVEINNHFVPYMRKKRWGRIVHVSSSAAYNYSAPSPYSSAKSALNTYVSSISRRLIKDKIVVSCICPGPIELPKRYMTISSIDLIFFFFALIF